MGRSTRLTVSRLPGERTLVPHIQMYNSPDVTNEHSLFHFLKQLGSAGSFPLIVAAGPCCLVRLERQVRVCISGSSGPLWDRFLFSLRNVWFVGSIGSSGALERKDRRIVRTVSLSRTTSDKPRESRHNPTGGRSRTRWLWRDSFDLSHCISLAR